MSDLIHSWIYVIIPIANTKIQEAAWLNNNQVVSQENPVFCAFCKACRSYFTEVLATDSKGKGKLSPGTLPRTGCNPIDDGGIAF